MHPHGPPVRRDHPILLVEQGRVGAVERTGLLESVPILGMHHAEPELWVARESLRRVAEYVEHLGAHEPLDGWTAFLGHLVRVGDARESFHELAIAALAAADVLVLELPPDRGAEQRGGGTERVDLGTRPVAYGRAVVEPHDAPPCALHHHGELDERDDPLAFELGSFLGQEIRDGAHHGLAGTVEVREPSEAVRPVVAREEFVALVGRDPRRAPLDGERAERRAVRTGVVLDHVRAGDFRGVAEPGDHVVGREPPVGREQQPLGRVRDRLEDRVAAQRCRCGPGCRVNHGAGDLLPRCGGRPYRGTAIDPVRGRSHGLSAGGPDDVALRTGECLGASGPTTDRGGALVRGPR